MSTIKLGICQNDLTANNEEYPKIVVIEKDTLVLITIENVDSINSTYITLDEYITMDSINKSIISMHEEREDNFWKPIIDEKDKQINTQDTIINNQKTIIKNSDFIIKEKDDKITKLKIHRAVAIGIAILMTIVAL